MTKSGPSPATAGAPSGRFSIAAAWRQARDGGWLALAGIALVYLMISSAAFSGFYDKWGLRDGDARYSLVAMLDGEAHRPFVYRQLLPTLANTLEAALPETLTQRIVDKLDSGVWWEARSLNEHMRVNFETERAYVLRYYLIYYACVGFLFLALFVMREICLDLGLSAAAATIAPAIFGLSTVYFFSMGGFFYDFPEIFFMSAAFLLALRNRAPWIVPLTVLAAWNKESFLFYLLTLFPIFNRRHAMAPAAAMTLGLAFVSGLTYLIVRAQFAGNPGATAESWLLPSLSFYADIRNLFAFETNYGIVTPRGYSIVTLLVTAALFAGAWRAFDRSLRRHTLLALAITVPLVVIFCGPGETRNFSICYMSLLLALAFSLERWMQRVTPPRAQSAA